MSNEQQWSGKTGGGNFGQKFLFFVLKRLKPSTLYPFVFISIPFYLLFSRTAYRAINRYFREIHHCTKWQARRKTAKNFYIFGQIVIDRFAMLAGNTQYLTMTTEGKDYVDNLFRSDKPFIIAGAHVGNLELIGHQFQQNSKNIYCLAFAGESKNIQTHRAQSMEHHKSILVPICSDMSHVFALKTAIENKDAITILCDRSNGNEKTCPINFMGKIAHFPIGSFMLAAKFNVEMVAVFVMKVKGMNYHLVAKPLIINELENLSAKEKATLLAEKYAAELENIIKQYPSQWFNFYDFWQKK